MASRSLAAIRSRTTRPAGTAGGAVIAHVVGRAADGAPVVEIPGDTHGPRAAAVVRECPQPVPDGARVVLIFQDGDLTRPIVVGTMGASPVRPGPATVAGVETAQDVVVDVPSLVIQARREIVLRCGAGSVTLRSDGTIVVRGTNLLSRSSGSNRIKGGSVRIN